MQNPRFSSETTPEDIAALTTGAALPKFEWVMVTPKMARDWLDTNPEGNRNVRPSQVAKYANDMEKGAFTYSNDTICFDTSGKLINGQHRMLAIIRVDRPILLAVQTGLPETTMVNMDTAIRRTPSDMLKWEGEANSALLGATAKNGILYLDGRLMGTSNGANAAVSNSDLLDFIEAYPEIRDSVEVAAKVCGKTRLDCKPSVVAVTHWLIADTDTKQHADLFFHRLQTRENEPAGSPILAIDNRLREARRAKSVYHNKYLMGFLIRGWNAWANDKKVRSLMIETRTQGDNFTMPPIKKWSKKER